MGTADKRPGPPAAALPRGAPRTLTSGYKFYSAGRTARQYRVPEYPTTSRHSNSPRSCLNLPPPRHSAEQQTRLAADLESESHSPQADDQEKRTQAHPRLSARSRTCTRRAVQPG